MSVYVAEGGLSVADVSALVSDEVDLGITAKVAQSLTWVTPTLINSWLDFGGSWAVAYSKDAFGVVRGGGLVTGGLNSSTTDIYTLPVGFRPIRRQMFSVVLANGVGRLDVNAAGAVSFNGLNTHTGNASTWLSVSYAFRAEQ